MIVFDRLMIVYDRFWNIEREKQTQDQMQTTCNNGTKFDRYVNATYLQ